MTKSLWLLLLGLGALLISPSAIAQPPVPVMTQLRWVDPDSAVLDGTYAVDGDGRGQAQYAVGMRFTGVTVCQPGTSYRVRLEVEQGSQEGASGALEPPQAVFQIPSGAHPTGTPMAWNEKLFLQFAWNLLATPPNFTVEYTVRVYSIQTVAGGCGTLAPTLARMTLNVTGQGRDTGQAASTDGGKTPMPGAGPLIVALVALCSLLRRGRPKP